MRRINPLAPGSCNYSWSPLSRLVDHSHLNMFSSYIKCFLWSPPAIWLRDFLGWLCLMISYFLRTIFVWWATLTSISASSTLDYTSNARAGYSALQQWYDQTTGLWQTTGWWNSANCITVLGDLATVDPSVKSQVTSVFANTFTQAQKNNPYIAKLVTESFNIQTIVASTPVVSSTRGFLNDYYDDEGWWALGWIQAYDFTGNTSYLNTAASIFNDMKSGTEPNCGGGIWWDKQQTYVNAIANELYISVAAHLANRVTSQKATYLGIAKSQWAWFQNSGMINSKWQINDGLTSTCTNNNGTVWSYNQGVILGALVELNIASPDASYLKTASAIANAAINKLSDSAGVLHDSCEPNCGSDGTQFKGIFMRNLQVLQAAAPSNNFLKFIATNSASIWTKDKNSANQFDVNWAGPYSGCPDASKQSSALDALVAAAVFQGSITDGIWSR